MSLDMREYANDLVATMAKAQTAGTTPATHGSDYARMSDAERSGYAKAMLDMIDHLHREAARERGNGSEIVAAGLRVAAQTLVAYRNEKLRAGPQ